MERRSPPFDLVQVGMADATDGDAEADLTGAGLREREIRELEGEWIVLDPAELAENHGAHGSILRDLAVLGASAQGVLPAVGLYSSSSTQPAPSRVQLSPLLQTSNPVTGWSSQTLARQHVSGLAPLMAQSSLVS